jgi:hypothetical protein
MFEASRLASGPGAVAFAAEEEQDFAVVARLAELLAEEPEEVVEEEQAEAVAEEREEVKEEKMRMAMQTAQRNREARQT